MVSSFIVSNSFFFLENLFKILQNITYPIWFQSSIEYIVNVHNATLNRITPILVLISIICGDRQSVIPDKQS